MATKRVMEKTNNDESKEEDSSSHQDKKPKLSDDDEESGEQKDEEKVDEENESCGDDHEEESTKERVSATLQTARREWLGHVERRHIRVGDEYQVTSLPTPETQEEGTRNQNGKKKE